MSWTAFSRQGRICFINRYFTAYLGAIVNGLELSEVYYTECGKDVLESTYASLMERVAVGLVGPGSECLGFDDQYSRDHDWGPSFCLWVTHDDFVRYGHEIQQCYDSLPGEFRGYGPRKMSPGETGRVGVIETGSFYRRYTGLSKPPETLAEWDLPSANLALCTNGKVFTDPLGEFSSWREHLLRFYPHDICLKKIADCCMRAGQAGQYNWQRGILRGDPFVITTAKVTFCTETIQLIYLLNKRYAPYFKWMFKGVGELPVLGQELAPYIEKILVNNDELLPGGNAWKDQQDRMEYICQRIIRELQHRGMTDMQAPFLTDHVSSLLGHIQDQDYRKRLWGGK